MFSETCVHIYANSFQDFFKSRGVGSFMYYIKVYMYDENITR